MSHPHTELVTRIRGEMIDLGRVVERAQQAWSLAQASSEPSSLYLDAVALNLHSFYSGLERLFELIARQLDGSVPAGETWHRQLLLQMA